MKQTITKTFITMIVMTLFSLSSQASTLDKGKNVFFLDNVPTMTAVPLLIEKIEQETAVNFNLSFEDENKIIYVSDKTVIISEKKSDGIEVKVLCASRKPNKEYKKVLNILQNNPTLSAPMEELE